MNPPAGFTTVVPTSTASANTVTDSPGFNVPSATTNVGVVSFVMSSLELTPLSSAAIRSTATGGAAGAVVSIVKADNPGSIVSFPAASVSETNTLYVPSTNEFDDGISNVQSVPDTTSAPKPSG